MRSSSDDNEEEEEESGSHKSSSRKESEDVDSDVMSGTTVISPQQIQAEKEKQFIPPYMQKSKPANEYEKYSVDELKQMLKELDVKMEKEIQEVKQKYEVQRKKFTSLFA